MKGSMAFWPRPHPTVSALSDRSRNDAALLLEKFPPDGRGTLYEQIARVLKSAILKGHFSAGQRLPSTRALAKSLGLSRNTVLRAYEILQSGQLTKAHERYGIYVASNSLPQRSGTPSTAVEPQSRYAARVRKLDLHVSDLPYQFLRYDLRRDPPFDSELTRLWSRKLAVATRVAGPRYPDAQGFRPLRAAIAEYLARRRAVTCSEDDILIVSGAQQAVSLVARVVLNEGDKVAMEDPNYPFMMQTLEAHGACIVSVRVDQDGMVTRELAPHKARLTCVCPSEQFPTGAVMSLERRVELIDIACRDRSWILEDDYDGAFDFRALRIAPLRSQDFAGRVIYIGSFSKTLFPSLRLGFIACPAGIRDDLCAAKRLDDLGSPSVAQAALAAFIRSRQFDKHLRRTTAILDHRRMIFRQSLLRHGGQRIVVQDAHTGTHLVVWLRRANYSLLARLIELGVERGLGLYPIHAFYRERPERPGLLLGYAGLSAEALERVGELFGECLDKLEGDNENSLVTADSSLHY